MSFRIKPIDPEPMVRKRRPRTTSNSHLAFIRKLPCVICGQRYRVEAAHLRTGNRLLGMRAVGIGEKPDDARTTPLCGGDSGHHSEQHRIGNELEFWARYRIENPWQLCQALYIASMAEDIALAETIVARHRLLAAGMGAGDTIKLRRRLQ